jgi:sugar (pentulose or hexulose) kinase
MLTTHRAEYSYHSSGMYVQIEAEKVWKAFLKVMGELRDYLNKVEMVVQCVFSPALIALDESGNPLYPAIIHWDRRSVKQAKEALAKVGRERFLGITGNIPYPGGISVTSILWLKEKEKEVFKRAFKFGHMNTFFVKRLTHQWSIDPTNASLTGLYNTVAYSDWSEEIAGELEIPVEKLPPLIPSTEIVGKVTREVARSTGIKFGTPVMMGSNDTSSAAVGAGVLKGGQILNISGSSEILTICLNRPIPDEKYYLRTHPLPDKWLMFDITTGGFALEWFRSQFCREMSKEEFYNSYLKKILEERTNCRVNFNPYLAGDRTSLRQKKASFSGLTLSSTRDECLYALMEGTVGRMKKTLKKMAKLINLDRTIYLTGGGATKVLMDYKRRLFPEFNLVVKENCSLQGCAFLAKMKLG